MVVGFTDDFNYRISTSGGLYQFNYCDEVFEVDLTDGAEEAATATQAATATAADQQPVA